MARTELEIYWYQKLEESGFQDIEDPTYPDRPLKRWDSHWFKSQETQRRRAEREEYLKQIDQFLNSGSVEEICALIVRHGNSKLSAIEVRMILEFHRDGFSRRKIAVKMHTCPDRVKRALAKAKEWMKIA